MASFWWNVSNTDGFCSSIEMYLSYNVTASTIDTHDILVLPVAHDAFPD